MLRAMHPAARAAHLTPICQPLPMRRCLTTRFNGTEEKARPKACLLWTLEPGAEPIVDQTDSRWISGRKPIAGAGGAPEPAPPAVAAPPSGAAAGKGGAGVHRCCMGWMERR